MISHPAGVLRFVILDKSGSEIRRGAFPAGRERPTVITIYDRVFIWTTFGKTTAIQYREVDAFKLI